MKRYGNILVESGAVYFDDLNTYVSRDGSNNLVFRDTVYAAEIALYDLANPAGTDKTQFAINQDDANDVYLQWEQADRLGIRKGVDDSLAELHAGVLILTTGTSVGDISTDGTLAGDSDDSLVTQQAIKEYVDTQVAGIDETVWQRTGSEVSLLNANDDVVFAVTGERIMFGDKDTYIYEFVDDTLRIVAGSVLAFQVTPSALSIRDLAFFSSSTFNIGSAGIAALGIYTDILYTDVISELNADAGITAEGVLLKDSNIILSATNKIFFDSGVDTYMTESSANVLDTYQADKLALRVLDYQHLGVGRGITAEERLTVNYGNLRFNTMANPGAPTAALAGQGAGNVDDGIHHYKIVFVDGDGGEGGTHSNYDSVTVVDKGVDGKVQLTNIPLGDDKYNVVARKIYRTTAGQPWSVGYLLATINDNTTTDYLDNIADSGLDTGDGFYRKENSSYGQIFLGASRVFYAGDVYRTTIGYNAGANLTTGSSLLFAGGQAGQNTTTGSNNVFLGYAVAYANTSGQSNIAIGYSAFSLNTTGGNNIAIGMSSVAVSGYTNYSYIVGIGVNAGGAGAGNVGIGYRALRYFVGGNNVGIGREALTGSSTPTNNTGTNNVVVGRDAGKLLESGSYNVLLGPYTGDNLVTGGRNILIGAQVDAAAVDSDYTFRLGDADVIILEGSTAVGDPWVGTSKTFKADIIIEYTIDAGVTIEGVKFENNDAYVPGKVTSGNYEFHHTGGVAQLKVLNGVLQASLRIEAGNNSAGVGGHIYFSAGNGSTTDGNLFIGWTGSARQLNSLYIGDGSAAIYLPNDEAETNLMAIDVTTGLVSYRSVASVGGGISFGNTDQIPHMNAGTPGTDFDYSADLRFDGTSLKVGAEGRFSGTITTATSGILTVKIGRLAGTIGNSTDAFVAVHNTGGMGALAGDLLLGSRSSVAAGIRMFTGSTALVERLTILSGGNVGIGIDTPTAKFHIYDSKGGNTYQRITSKVGSESALFFGDVDDEVEAGIVYNSGDQKLYFRGYNNDVRITIDNAGNVGIGTTIPSHGRLHITHGAIPVVYHQSTVDSYIRFVHDGSSPQVRWDWSITGGVAFTTTETALKMYKDGAVEAFYNGSLKLATTDAGVTVTGDAIFNVGGVTTYWEIDANGQLILRIDNITAVFARALSFKNDATTYMQIGAYGANSTFGSGFAYIGKAYNDVCAKFYPDAAAVLYYNNAKKFKTATLGIYVTGEVKSSTGYFASGIGNVYLGVTGGGTVYLRPTAYGSATAQSAFAVAQALIGTPMEVTGNIGVNYSAAVAAVMGVYNTHASGHSRIGLSTGNGTYDIYLELTDTNEINFLGTDGYNLLTQDASGNISIGPSSAVLIGNSSDIVTLGGIYTAINNRVSIIDGVVANYSATFSNTSSGGYGLYVNVDSTGVNYVIHAASDTGNLFEVRASGVINMPNIGSGAQSNYLYYNTTGGGVTYSSSDISLKENIHIWDFDSLKFLRALPVKKYDRIDGSVIGEVGWIAQDVESLVPGMINQHKGLKSIKEPWFLPNFHRAIVQVDDKVVLLEKRVSDLEAENMLLRNEIEQLKAA